MDVFGNLAGSACEIQCVWKIASTEFWRLGYREPTECAYYFNNLKHRRFVNRDHFLHVDRDHLTGAMLFASAWD